MKSLVLCVLSSKYESEMVDKVKEFLQHRLTASSLRTVIAGSGFLPEDFIAVCQDAYNEGFKRIFIQAATMAFSEARYHDLLSCIENTRQALPEIELTIFPPTQFYELCADIIERNVYHASLKDVPYSEVSPDDIQDKSFRFISGRLAKSYNDPDVQSVIVRIIHALADFSVERLLYFSDNAVAKGMNALKNGCDVITDIGMVAAGLMTRFKERTVSAVNQNNVALLAKERGITRSAAGMELLSDRLEGTVVAIGNAPTALVHLLKIVERSGVRPACVVGVPVGFVGAAESKELLMASGIPCISIKGNRGGTPVAVAAVNAMGALLDVSK